MNIYKTFRIIAYKYALDRLNQNAIKDQYGYGICFCLEEWMHIHTRLYIVAEAIFPELKNMRPVTHKKAWWYPLTKSGYEKRVEWLEMVISHLEKI